MCVAGLPGADLSGCQPQANGARERAPELGRRGRHRDGEPCAERTHQRGTRFVFRPRSLRRQQDEPTRRTKMALRLPEPDDQAGLRDGTRGPGAVEADDEEPNPERGRSVQQHRRARLDADPGARWRAEGRHPAGRGVQDAGPAAALHAHGQGSLRGPAPGRNCRRGAQEAELFHPGGVPRTLQRPPGLRSAAAHPAFASCTAGRAPRVRAGCARDDRQCRRGHQRARRRRDAHGRGATEVLEGGHPLLPARLLQDEDRVDRGPQYGRRGG
mmetsp:Transcript_21828/g.70671  ORF Transcript_21828/g.70671 Transcript_21828/m.70671 type:complete len:271 (-) Transcript_21828:1388-2200(-)